MPTITIDRSTSRLPSSTGLSPSGTIQLDQTSILGEVGKVIGEFQAKAQEAEDSTYLAKAGVEATKRREALRSELRQKYANNPKGYSEELYARMTEEVYNPIAEAAPSSNSRQATMEYMARFAQNDIVQDTAWEKEATVVNYKASTDEAINVLANNVRENPNSIPEAAAQLEVLLKSSETYLDPLQVNEYRMEKKKELAKSSIIGTMEKSTAAAKNLLNTGEFDGLFNADEMERFIDAIDRKEASNEAKRNKYIAEQKDKAGSELILAMHRASSPEEISKIGEQLDTALASGVFSASEYVSYANRLDSKQDKIVESENLRNKIILSKEYGVPLDPNNKEDKKAIEQDFEEHFMPTLQNLPEDEVNQRVSGYVEQHGVVPSQLESAIVAGIANGNPDSKVKAAQQLKLLVDQNPSVIAQFPKTYVDAAYKIANGKLAGLSTEDAVKAAEVQVFEKNTEQYKSKEAEFSNKDNYVAFDYDRFDVNKEEAPQGMVEDYNAAYRASFVDRGNSHKEASDLAAKMVEANWGYSDLSGKWMRNPPEKIYGRASEAAGLGTEWIKKDLQKTVSQAVSSGMLVSTKDGVELPPEEKAKVDEILSTAKIVVAPQYEGSKTPAYMVMYKTDRGYDFVPSSAKDKRPLLWRPSWETSNEYNQVKKEAEKRKMELPAYRKSLKERSEAEKKAFGSRYGQEISQ